MTVLCKHCGENIVTMDGAHNCKGPQVPIVFDLPVSTTKLQKEFEAFHTNNLHVYELFKKYTLQVIASGFNHYSARTIIHRIRWHTSIDTDDPEGFKINNNHSPYYSRMFVTEFPRHTGFFRDRKIKGAA